VLEHRHGEDGVEVTGGEVPRELMGIAHDMDVLARDDVEADVVRTREAIGVDVAGAGTGADLEEARLLQSVDRGGKPSEGGVARLGAIDAWVQWALRELDRAEHGAPRHSTGERDDTTRGESAAHLVQIAHGFRS